MGFLSVPRVISLLSSTGLFKSVGALTYPPQPSNRPHSLCNSLYYNCYTPEGGFDQMGMTTSPNPSSF
eukprot:scaffold286054_cov18-Tisochrysis_lutea.AAC.1